MGWKDFVQIISYGYSDSRLRDEIELEREINLHNNEAREFDFKMTRNYILLGTGSIVTIIFVLWKL